MPKVERKTSDLVQTIHIRLYMNTFWISKSFNTPNDGFFLRAESFYNVASYIDEIDAIKSYGGVSLHEQSHGESFFSLFMNRFSGQGLYILDEPGPPYHQWDNFLCSFECTN